MQIVLMNEALGMNTCAESEQAEYLLCTLAKGVVSNLAEQASSEALEVSNQFLKRNRTSVMFIWSAVLGANSYEAPEHPFPFTKEAVALADLLDTWAKWLEEHRELCEPTAWEQFKNDIPYYREDAAEFRTRIASL